LRLPALLRSQKQRGWLQEEAESSHWAHPELDSHQSKAPAPLWWALHKAALLVTATSSALQLLAACPPVHSAPAAVALRQAATTTAEMLASMATSACSGASLGPSKAADELQQWLPHAATAVCNSLTAYLQCVARSQLATLAPAVSAVHFGPESPSARFAAHRPAAPKMEIDARFASAMHALHSAVSRCAARLAAPVSRPESSQPSGFQARSAGPAEAHSHPDTAPWELMDATALLCEVWSSLHQLQRKVRYTCLPGFSLAENEQDALRLSSATSQVIIN
jgi:hypothetical protein